MLIRNISVCCLATVSANVLVHFDSQCLLSNDTQIKGLMLEGMRGQMSGMSSASIGLLESDMEGFNNISVNSEEMAELIGFARSRIKEQRSIYEAEMRELKIDFRESKKKFKSKPRSVQEEDIVDPEASSSGHRRVNVVRKRDSPIDDDEMTTFESDTQTSLPETSVNSKISIEWESGPSEGPEGSSSSSSEERNATRARSMRREKRREQRDSFEFSFDSDGTPTNLTAYYNQLISAEVDDILEGLSLTNHHSLLESSQSHNDSDGRRSEGSGEKLDFFDATAPLHFFDNVMRSSDRVNPLHIVAIAQYISDEFVGMVNGVVRDVGLLEHQDDDLDMKGPGFEYLPNIDAMVIHSNDDSETLYRIINGVPCVSMLEHDREIDWQWGLFDTIRRTVNSGWNTVRGWFGLAPNSHGLFNWGSVGNGSSSTTSSSSSSGGGLSSWLNWIPGWSSLGGGSGGRLTDFIPGWNTLTQGSTGAIMDAMIPGWSVVTETVETMLDGERPQEQSSVASASSMVPSGASMASPSAMSMGPSPTSGSNGGMLRPLLDQLHISLGGVTTSYHGSPGGGYPMGGGMSSPFSGGGSSPMSSPFGGASPMSSPFVGSSHMSSPFGGSNLGNMMPQASGMNPFDSPTGLGPSPTSSMGGYNTNYDNYLPSPMSPMSAPYSEQAMSRSMYQGPSGSGYDAGVQYPRGAFGMGGQESGSQYAYQQPSTETFNAGNYGQGEQNAGYRMTGPDTTTSTTREIEIPRPNLSGLFDFGKHLIPDVSWNIDVGLNPSQWFPNLGGGGSSGGSGGSSYPNNQQSQGNYIPSYTGPQYDSQPITNSIYQGPQYSGPQTQNQMQRSIPYYPQMPSESLPQQPSYNNQESWNSAVNQNPPPYPYPPSSGQDPSYPYPLPPPDPQQPIYNYNNASPSSTSDGYNPASSRVRTGPTLPSNNSQTSQQWSMPGSGGTEGSPSGPTIVYPPTSGNGGYPSQPIASVRSPSLTLPELSPTNNEQSQSVTGGNSTGGQPGGGSGGLPSIGIPSLDLSPLVNYSPNSNLGGYTFGLPALPSVTIPGINNQFPAIDLGGMMSPGLSGVLGFPNLPGPGVVLPGIVGGVGSTPGGVPGVLVPVDPGSWMGVPSGVTPAYGVPVGPVDPGYGTPGYWTPGYPGAVGGRPGIDWMGFEGYGGRHHSPCGMKLVHWGQWVQAIDPHASMPIVDDDTCTGGLVSSDVGPVSICHTVSQLMKQVDGPLFSKDGEPYYSLHDGESSVSVPEGCLREYVTMHVTKTLNSDYKPGPSKCYNQINEQSAFRLRDPRDGAPVDVKHGELEGYMKDYSKDLGSLYHTMVSKTHDALGELTTDEDGNTVYNVVDPITGQPLNVHESEINGYIADQINKLYFGGLFHPIDDRHNSPSPGRRCLQDGNLVLCDPDTDSGLRKSYPRSDSSIRNPHDPVYFWYNHSTICSFSEARRSVFIGPDGKIDWRLSPCQGVGFENGKFLGNVDPSWVPSLIKDKRHVVYCLSHSRQNSYDYSAVMNESCATSGARFAYAIPRECSIFGSVDKERPLFCNWTPPLLAPNHRNAATLNASVKTKNINDNENKNDKTPVESRSLSEVATEYNISSDDMETIVQIAIERVMQKSYIQNIFPFTSVQSIADDINNSSDDLSGQVYLPNDPELKYQWYLFGKMHREPFGLHIIDTWNEVHSQTKNVNELADAQSPMVVAISDSGCWSMNPDLSDKVDPKRSYDFGDNRNHVHQTPLKHGTQTAGLIAGSTDNGVGLASTCPSCKLLCLKIVTTHNESHSSRSLLSNSADTDGVHLSIRDQTSIRENDTDSEAELQISSTAAPPKKKIKTSSIIRAIDHMIESGARVSNHSYGGFGDNAMEKHAFQRLTVGRNHLAFIAAGNSECNIDCGMTSNEYLRAIIQSEPRGNNSRLDVKYHPNSKHVSCSTYPPCHTPKPFTPASYPFSNIITTGSSDRDGQIADFSNVGHYSVDVFAPGADILTLDTPAGHSGQYAMGTSYSSPMVAGVTAWVWSQFPDATSSDIKEALIESVTKVNGMETASVSGGVVNTLQMYRHLKSKFATPAQ